MSLLRIFMTLGAFCVLFGAAAFGPTSAVHADAPYDREAAQYYALTYSARANPFYRRYSDAGGDCTSFTSQVLSYGGWGYADGFLWDRGNVSSWWYTTLGIGAGFGTATWSNANDFFLFLLGSRRAHLISDPALLTVGDVVQMIWSYDPTEIGHTAVADYVGKDGTLYFAQHDNNTPFDTFANYLSYDHGVKFLYWHIDDRYPSNDPLPFFRYYNPQLNDHFYTTRWSELGVQHLGYTLERVQCELCAEPASGTAPLYRYYNSRLQDHFYTSNWSELGGGAAGYSFEKIAGYVYQGPVAGMRALYRYRNLNSGHHLYTTDPNELRGRNDFRSEGVVGYALP